MAESKTEKNHPLEPPFEQFVENDGMRIYITESSIGLHRFRLDFKSENEEPIGYGWFDTELASKLLGVKPPKDFPKGDGTAQPNLLPAGTTRRDLHNASEKQLERIET